MAAKASLDVRFFAPPADIAGCFTTFYRLEIEVPNGRLVEDQLQPEWANLRFFASNPPQAFPADGAVVKNAPFQASGPSSKPTPFALGTTRMWGIGLLPLGWARYVGVPAHEHVNTLVDGEREPIFKRFAPLVTRLCRPGGDDASDFVAITDFFRDAARPTRDDHKIAAIHQALVDPHLCQVSDLARNAGLNTRTLERACQRHFGFSPRLLIRRQRLMRTLAAFMLGDGASWTEAIDAHYHDQAHFVHEFHSFMGMSPSEYIRRPHPILSAFMAERQRVWGSPVQTLDRPA